MGRHKKSISIGSLEMLGIPVLPEYNAPETLQGLADTIGTHKITLLKGVMENSDDNFKYRLRTGIFVERIPNR
jgi:hypothetical protein